MRVVEALPLLAAAMQRVGVEPWEAPPSSTELERLQAALAPMRLPEELVTFWRLVDVSTFRVDPYPQFVRPQDALGYWTMVRDEFADFSPLACVQVGYSSHDNMGMELDVDDVPGGSLFEWFISDPNDPFVRRFDSLGDWLAYLVLLIDRGLYDRFESDRGAWLMVPTPDQRPEAEAIRPMLGRHPIHGERLTYTLDEWPEHWRQVSRLRRTD